MARADTIDPRQIVDDYLEALMARDFERARSLLADSGFHYVSPIHTFDDADAFIEFSLYSSGVVGQLEVRKVFADENDVCHLLTLTTYLGDKGHTPVAQWTQVDDNGRIRRIELLFDAHEFKVMFE
jgi:hypothetical protein